MFRIDRKELTHTLLIAAFFMAMGLSFVDRMIGDPAALPSSEQS